MANKDGVITRKDLIADDALYFGDTYAKELQKAIDKNKELVSSSKELAKLSGSFRKSSNNAEYAKNIENEIRLTNQANTVWREQIQLENNLISAQRRRQLASESTNRALISERIQIEEQNRAIRQQAREQLGLSGAYDRLAQRRNAAQRTLQNLLSVQNQDIVAVRKAQREFDILDGKIRKVDQATRNFSRNVGNYQSVWTGTANGVRNLIGAFGIMGGVALFATIVRNIYNVSKELNALDVAFKAVTDTEATYLEQQEFVNKISEKYGLEIKSLTRTYTQFWAASKDKLAGEEIQQIFDKVSKSAAVMGLSVEQQEGVFLALQQMMSKGTVQAEEIRGQLGERLPGAFSLLAKSMGVTEQKLGDMLKQGQVMAKDVLPKFADELEKAYGADKVDRITTMVAEQNRLSNAWTDFVRELNEGDSVISKVFGGFITWSRGALEGINLLMQSEEKRRNNLSKNLENQAYEAQRGEIEKMTEAEAKLNAVDFLRDNAARVSELEQMNRKLEEGNKYLKERIEAMRLDDPRQSAGIISDFSKKLEQNTKQINDNKDAIAFNTGEMKAYAEVLTDKTKKVVDDSKTEEETEKERRKREKARLDYLRRLKQMEDDDFELRQSRLQREIELSKEIVDNEKENTLERVEMSSNATQVEIAKAKEAAEHKLKEYSRYDDAIRDLNDAEIKTLINGGTIKKDLHNKELQILEEFQFEATKIAKKGQEERDKLVAFDVAKFQAQLDKELQAKSTALNNDLTAENERFNSLSDLEQQREENVEEHERKIYGIKKFYALEGLKYQVKAIEDLLAAQDQLPEKEKVNADTRAKIENDLSDYKRQISELELEDFQGNSEKKKATAEEEAEFMKEIGERLKDALVDLANAIFDARIQNIDNEISKNEEYYDKQIKLAGDDQAQKDLLEEEAEKKRKVLEDKKRKEQHKQAVFNKAMAALNVGVSTALAIMQAYAQLGPIAGSVAAIWVAALGAVQLAAVIAAPIPKYAKGRKDGKDEIAWLGDGGRHEVVEHTDGSYYVTPNKPTLGHLLEGDRVYSSVDEFNKTKRFSALASLAIESRKLNDFQAEQYIKDAYGKEMLDELILTRKAIEKSKPNINVYSQKVDIPHSMWKGKNTNWTS